MAEIGSSENVMGRRDFIREVSKLALQGITFGAILSAVGDVARLNPPQTFPDISRSLGKERAFPIPRNWYRTLDTLTIDSVKLSRPNINDLTDSMREIPYSRVCKSNINAEMPAAKYGVTLPEAMDMVRLGQPSYNGLVRVEATDWYTLVHDDAEQICLSISKTNIPEKNWYGKGFEQARNARATYSGVFLPQEKNTAWKDLVDVKDVFFTYDNIKPATYFMNPDGEIIKPEKDNVHMKLNDLTIQTSSDNETTRIPYSMIQEITNESTMIYDNKEIPYISMKDFLSLANIEQENIALILHANNYAISIPPWRQQDLKILFDDYYENKYGVPTKLIGGDFFNKAAQIGGFYKIEVIPFYA